MKKSLVVLGILTLVIAIGAQVLINQRDKQGVTRASYSTYADAQVDTITFNPQHDELALYFFMKVKDTAFVTDVRLFRLVDSTWMSIQAGDTLIGADSIKSNTGGVWNVPVTLTPLATQFKLIRTWGTGNGVSSPNVKSGFISRY
jgi:hypothetical protein